MKNIIKVFIAVLMIVSVYKSFASIQKHPEELSCQNGQGTEVSIGSTCSRGGDGCVENACPRGTSGHQF